MLHRAIFGSMERFIGILIEHYAGKFPLWLSPLQVVVCTIVSDADDYARKVQAALEKAGLLVELDLRNEKIGYKVREHSLAKVPVVLAVGKRDQEGGTVALRYLGEESQKVLPLDEAVRTLAEHVRSPLEMTH
jgi:threonyl-tRNA synthetase